MNETFETLLKNPNMAKVILSSILEKYKPLVYAVGDEVLKVYKDYANNNELAQTKATARMNQFKAYREVGFSDTEAMSLLLTDIRQVAQLIEKSGNGVRVANVNNKK